MVSAEDIKKEIEVNKKNRLEILSWRNKISKVTLSYMQALRDYSLKFISLDAEVTLSKNNYLLKHSDILFYNHKMQLINITLANLNKETLSLDADLAQASARLDQLNRLDPKLLAEYRKLKEDLEMQEMLIQISESNQ